MVEKGFEGFLIAGVRWVGDVGIQEGLHALKDKIDHGPSHRAVGACRKMHPFMGGAALLLFLHVYLYDGQVIVGHRAQANGQHPQKGHQHLFHPHGLSIDVVIMQK